MFFFFFFGNRVSKTVLSTILPVSSGENEHVKIPSNKQTCACMLKYKASGRFNLPSAHSFTKAQVIGKNAINYTTIV